MKTLSEELVEVLETNKKKLIKDDSIKEMEKAVKNFEDLVSQGVISKRGYTLMTSDQKYSVSLNQCAN